MKGKYSFYKRDGEIELRPYSVLALTTFEKILDEVYQSCISKVLKSGSYGRLPRDKLVEIFEVEEINHSSAQSYRIINVGIRIN